MRESHWLGEVPFPPIPPIGRESYEIEEKQALGS